MVPAAPTEDAHSSPSLCLAASSASSTTNVRPPRPVPMVRPSSDAALGPSAPAPVVNTSTGQNAAPGAPGMDGSCTPDCGTSTPAAPVIASSSQALPSAPELCDEEASGEALGGHGSTGSDDGDEFLYRPDILRLLRELLSTNTAFQGHPLASRSKRSNNNNTKYDSRKRPPTQNNP